MLDAWRPGRLEGVPVVAMGGWVWPPADGLPAWGPASDWNVQCDTQAARILADRADLTLVTLPAAMDAWLREVHLPRLTESGALGALLARQSNARADDGDMRRLGRNHDGLPNDLVNFHWDPVACAIALDWSGATFRNMRVQPVVDDGVLRFKPDQSGRPLRVVTAVDGDAFAETWLDAVERAQLP